MIIYLPLLDTDVINLFFKSLFIFKEECVERVLAQDTCNDIIFLSIICGFIDLTTVSTSGSSGNN